MTGAIRRYLFENPSKFDPRDYLKPAREAAKKVCIARFQAFGCAGQASKIKPIPLEKMAELYKSGKLAQIVKWTQYASFVRHFHSITPTTF